MTLNYEKLMELDAVDVPCNYTERDSLLYALGVGFGADPLDEKELPYVVETMGRCTVPTMATTLTPENILDNCGWNYAQVLHGEQKLELYRPLPMAAELLTTSRVASVHDRGAGRGAVIRMAMEARLKRDDTALFTIESTLIARGDGGFGGPPGSLEAPHKLPEREPDLSCDLLIRPDQALLYRLLGDRNPLHADPSIARAAGFDAPILHGLCTYGIACRAILITICDYDFTLINGFQARFSAPVYPGDVLTTDMWQERNVVSFRCHVKSRKSVVLNNGKCLLAA
jgi:acyl dehydratase